MGKTEPFLENISFNSSKVGYSDKCNRIMITCSILLLMIIVMTIALPKLMSNHD